MTPQTKNYLLWVIGVLIVGGFIWWGRGDRQMSHSESIRIGVVASMTGPGSFYGENIRKGVELALHEINTEGGVHGRRIEAIYEDDATNPKQTVSAVQKLIDVDGVVAIVGVQWDFLANAAIPVLEQRQVVGVSASASFDSILSENQRSSYFFTAYPSIHSNLSSVITFFHREDVTTAAIIALSNDWGQAHVQMYRDAAREAGVEIVEEFRFSQTDSNDLRTPLGRIRELKPDAILFALNDGDNISFTNRYHEFGLAQKVLQNANFSGLLDTGKVGFADTEGFYFFEYSEPHEDFIRSFKQFHGEVPLIASDTAYDSIYVIKESIERGGEASPAGVAKGMRLVDNFQGAAGPIDFTTSNYPKNKRSILKQIVGNKFELIEP